MKIYNELEDTLISEYKLSTLMTLDEFPKRKGKISNNPTVQDLLRTYLADFGIYFNGRTYLRDREGAQTGIMVRYCFINVESIPLENLAIIPQLYGWEDVVVNLSIKAYDEYAHSCDYYTKTGQANLIENIYGSSRVVKEFESLSELVQYYRNNKL
jgi:hypothetical protein